MMAVDFLFSSSSVKAGLVGVWGGGGVAVVSRFAVQTKQKRNKIIFEQSEFMLTFAEKQISKSTIILFLCQYSLFFWVEFAKITFWLFGVPKEFHSQQFSMLRFPDM